MLTFSIGGILLWQYPLWSNTTDCVSMKLSFKCAVCKEAFPPLTFFRVVPLCVWLFWHFTIIPLWKGHCSQIKTFPLNLRPHCFMTSVESHWNWPQIVSNLGFRLMVIGGNAGVQCEFDWSTRKYDAKVAVFSGNDRHTTYNYHHSCQSEMIGIKMTIIMIITVNPMRRELPLASFERLRVF